jgi:hypothetical protein
MGVYKTADSTKRPRFAPKVERRKLPLRIPEWRLQAEAVAHLHRLEKSGWNFTCAADMNAGARNWREQAEAKVTGLTKGEADLRIYLPNGRLGMIEYKGDGGRLSNAQKARHARLKELGHNVITLKVKTLEEARVETEKVVASMLGRNG